MGQLSQLCVADQTLDSTGHLNGNSLFQYRTRLHTDRCSCFCVAVWGECSHCFHIHCIEKWIAQSQQVNQQCPMCRQEWKFKV